MPVFGEHFHLPCLLYGFRYYVLFYTITIINSEFFVFYYFLFVINIMVMNKWKWKPQSRTVLGLDASHKELPSVAARLKSGFVHHFYLRTIMVAGYPGPRVPGSKVTHGCTALLIVRGTIYLYTFSSITWTSLSVMNSMTTILLRSKL